jgi:hypothetical protein
VGVAPGYVTALITLEIPRGNDYYISFSDPNAALHLPPDSTQTFFAILTFDHNAIKAQQFNNNAQNLPLGRVYHFV